MGYKEKSGHWPLMKNKKMRSSGSEGGSGSSYTNEKDVDIAYPKKIAGNDGNIVTEVNSVSS